MSAALAHRGPDGAGHHLDAALGLAIRRLALVDPVGGAQPIANEDGIVRVICNGELYDHRALRRRLERRGHTFRTGSDVEVLVHLYEERGPAFVEDLRGMFAVALWDARERRLVLARDPFGIKPLVYARLGQRLAFASELKALLALPDSRARSTRGGRELPRAQRRSRAGDDLPRGAQARARAPPDRRPPRRPRSSATRGHARRGERAAPRAARRAGRGGARAARRLRARAPRRRRAGRGAALRRRGLEPGHRARRGPARR